MLQLIKKMLPVHIARVLRQLKIKTIDHYKKEHAAKKMGKEHPRLLAKLSDKKKNPSGVFGNTRKRMES